MNPFMEDSLNMRALNTHMLKQVQILFSFSFLIKGTLSMASTGVNSNGSQFFITCADCAWYSFLICI